MRTFLLFGLGFALGGFGRDAARLAWNRYMTWRYNRAFDAAQERMRDCAHERRILTDCGMGLNTEKCLDCWALYFTNGPASGQWCANQASPREAQKLTRELQSNRGADRQARR